MKKWQILLVQLVIYFNLTEEFNELGNTLGLGANWSTRASTIICLGTGIDGLNVISIASNASSLRCIS